MDLREIVVSPLDVRYYDGSYHLFLIISSHSPEQPDRATLNVEYESSQQFSSEILLSGISLPVLVCMPLPSSWNQFSNIPGPYQLLIRNGTSDGFRWSSAIYKRTSYENLEAYFDNRMVLINIDANEIHRTVLPHRVINEERAFSKLTIWDNEKVIHADSSADRYAPHSQINTENVTMEFVNDFNEVIGFALHCQDCFLWIELSTNDLFDMRSIGRRFEDIRFKVFLIFNHGSTWREITSNCIMESSDHFHISNGVLVLDETTFSDGHESYVESRFFHLTSKVQITQWKESQFHILPSDPELNIIADCSNREEYVKSQISQNAPALSTGETVRQRCGISIRATFTNQNSDQIEREFNSLIDSDLLKVINGELFVDDDLWFIKSTNEDDVRLTLSSSSGERLSQLKIKTSNEPVVIHGLDGNDLVTSDGVKESLKLYADLLRYDEHYRPRRLFTSDLCFAKNEILIPDEIADSSNHIPEEYDASYRRDLYHIPSSPSDVRTAEAHFTISETTAVFTFFILSIFSIVSIYYFLQKRFRQKWVKKDIYVQSELLNTNRNDCNIHFS